MARSYLRRRDERRHAPLEGDIAVVGLGRAIRQGLQLVVGLARQVVVGVAIARDVIARDAHAPDVHVRPALLLGVKPRRLAARHAPELLLAVTVIAVVVPVVAHAQVTPAGAIPIAEQHRERAPRRSQRDRRSVAGARGVRPDQLVAEAQVVRIGRRLVQIVAERQRRQRRRAFPLGTERRGPGVAAIERPGLVGALEAAVAEAPQELVLATPQHGQVRPAVAVDVERVGTGDVGPIGDWVARPQRTAARRRPGSRCDTGSTGLVPPAKNRSGRPSSLQSNTATPPPT